MDLSKQLQGVKPDSPAGVTEDPPVETPEPEEGEANAAETGHGEGEEGEGRTIENVYRELSRKQIEDAEANRAFQERMIGALGEITSKISEYREPAKPDQSTGNTLDEYSVSQLDGLRGQVPEEKLVEFDAYVMNRKIDAKVDEKVGKFSQAQSFETKRETSVQEAMNRFTDLNDPDSEFYKDVDKELRSRGADYSKGNAQAILDTASYVAASTGYGVRQAAQPRIPSQQGRRTGAPVQQEEDKGGMTTERAEELAAGLQNALPPGKKFDIKKIRENANEYIENSDLFIRQ